MKNRLLLALMAAAIAILAVSGCGKKDPAPDPDTNTPGGGFTELSTLYTEPVTTWKISRDELVSRLGPPDAEQRSTQDPTMLGIGYMYNDPVCRSASYTLSDIFGLYIASLQIVTNDVSKIDTFLKQRYTRYYNLTGSALAYYGDNTNYLNAKTFIYYIAQNNYYRVYYADRDRITITSNAPSRGSDGQQYTVEIPDLVEPY